MKHWWKRFQFSVTFSIIYEALMKTIPILCHIQWTDNKTKLVTIWIFRWCPPIWNRIKPSYWCFLAQDKLKRKKIFLDFLIRWKVCWSVGLFGNIHCTFSNSPILIYHQNVFYFYLQRLSAKFRMWTRTYFLRKMPQNIIIWVCWITLVLMDILSKDIRKF